MVFEERDMQLTICTITSHSFCHLVSASSSHPICNKGGEDLLHPRPRAKSGKSMNTLGAGLNQYYMEVFNIFSSQHQSAKRKKEAELWLALTEHMRGRTIKK